MEPLTEAAFTEYADAVSRLPRVGQFRIETWPVLTLLPFLGVPSRHMFLKPAVTQRAAHILGFDLQYRPDLNWLTYKQLLVIARELMVVLGPLGARDMVDVQSFLWVAITYAA